MTAAAKSQTNRARSVAAGVVSGAGLRVSRCFKRCTLMRVPPVGPGGAWTPVHRPRGRWGGVVPARQWERRVRANGWCRAQEHTRKRRRDEPVSMTPWAGGVQSFTGPLQRRQTTFGRRGSGDRPPATDGQPSQWSQCHDDVNETVLRSRNHHGWATATGEYSARGRPDNTGSASRPRRRVRILRNGGCSTGAARTGGHVCRGPPARLFRTRSTVALDPRAARASSSILGRG